MVKRKSHSEERVHTGLAQEAVIMCNRSAFIACKIFCVQYTMLEINLL